ncbi:MAG TPA: glycosyltransferase family 39 protein [Blastocatellia bacterium]|nr:glycosyltransferase family 39 protein [Blastocatellia bacterium]
MLDRLPHLRALRRHLAAAIGVGAAWSLRKRILFGLLIFAVSFTVKCLVAVDLSPTLVADRQAFSRWEFERDALAVAGGKGILIPEGWPATDTSLLFHAPGYAIFLGAIYSASGTNHFTVLLVHNAFNSLAAVLIFLIAGELLAWPVGLATGLIAALSHHLSYYSNFLLPDTICVLPLLAAMLLLVKAWRGRLRWPYPVAGLLLGLTVWLRPNALLLGPFVALAFWLLAIRRPPRLRAAGWWLTAACLLVIAPITIRNYVIYHEFVPVSANLGIVMWEGIADYSGDRFGAVTTDQGVAEQEAVWYNQPDYADYWASPDGIQRDHDRVRRSLAVIRDHPFWFAGITCRRIGEMFKYSASAPLVFARESSRAANTDAGAEPESQSKKVAARQEQADHSVVLGLGHVLGFARPAARAAQRLVKETLYLFILIGAPLLLVLSPRRAMFLLIVPLYFVLVQAPLHLEFRYTLPMQYFVYVFAGFIWILLSAAFGKLIRKAARRTQPC